MQHDAAAWHSGRIVHASVLVAWTRARPSLGDKRRDALTCCFGIHDLEAFFVLIASGQTTLVHDALDQLWPQLLNAARGVHAESLDLTDEKAVTDRMLDLVVNFAVASSSTLTIDNVLATIGDYDLPARALLFWARNDSAMCDWLLRRGVGFRLLADTYNHSEDENETKQADGEVWDCLAHPLHHKCLSVVARYLELAPTCTVSDAHDSIDCVYKNKEALGTRIAIAWENGAHEFVTTAARYGNVPALELLRCELDKDLIELCATEACRAMRLKVVQWAIAVARERTSPLSLDGIARNSITLFYVFTRHGSCIDSECVIRWLCHDETSHRDENTGRNNIDSIYSCGSRYMPTRVQWYFLFATAARHGDVGCALWLAGWRAHWLTAADGPLIQKLARRACRYSTRSGANAPSYPAVIDRVVRLLERIAAAAPHALPLRFDLWPWLVRYAARRERDLDLALNALRHAAMRASPRKQDAPTRARSSLLRPWNDCDVCAPFDGDEISNLDILGCCHRNLVYDRYESPRIDGPITASREAWARWCNPRVVDAAALKLSTTSSEAFDAARRERTITRFLRWLAPYVSRSHLDVDGSVPAD